jgi:hypothetical protein
LLTGCAIKRSLVMVDSAYMIGRTIAPFQSPFLGTDQLYAATRLDRQTIATLPNGTFAHCTFANISFKQCTVEHLVFNDCVFLACYFRRAAFRDCVFRGCRFIDCDFSQVSMTGTVFRYGGFTDCFIDFNSVQLSLPPEPNLKQELTHNLSQEAAKLGFPSEARKFRLCEIRAKEEHLRLAVRGASIWYQRHYPRFRRMGAALSLVGSLSNRYMWGYGEQAWRLVANFVLLTFGVFPLIYYFSLRDSLTKNSGPIDFVDSLYFSLQNILPGAINSGVTAQAFGSRAVAEAEAWLGIMVAGLLGTYLFRWIMRR